MKPKAIYLALCFVGAALPYWQFVPWVVQHGMDFPLFVHELFTNRISAFFAMAVLPRCCNADGGSAADRQLAQL